LERVSGGTVFPHIPIFLPLFFGLIYKREEKRKKRIRTRELPGPGSGKKEGDDKLELY
jgi:hypothetical protein